MKNSLYHLCPLWLLACLQGFVISVLLTACSDGTERRLQLEELERQNRADSVMTNDSLARDLADYFDRHGTPNERMRAHYILGRTYADCGEAPQAIEAYNDAAAAADTTASDCDYATLGRVYTQKANLFNQQLLLSNEVSARQQARHCFLCAKDTFYAIYHLGMIAGNYILMNKQDSAEILLHETIRQYREHGYEQDALQFSTSLMHLYVNQDGRLSELKQLIDQYDNRSEQFDEYHYLPPSQRIFYYYKGKYYEGINRLDSAEYYYRKVYRPNMAYSSQTVMYKGLLSVFGKRHQADSISKYAMLYCMVTDSSVIIKDQQQTALLEASYDYVYYKNQSIEKAELSQTRLYYLYVLTIVIAVLVIVGIVSHNQYVKQREKKQTEIKLLTSECMSLGEKLAGKEHELQSLEDNHKRTVETIQKELDAAKKESTDFEDKYDESQSIIGKLNAQHEQEKKKLEGEISSYKGEIADLERKITIYAGVEPNTPFLNLGVVKRVLFYADRPDKALSEEDINSLIDATMEFYPDFIHDLRNTPKIGDVGLKVGILVALNIKPRDIGHLLGMPYNQISNIKQDLNVGLFKENTARTLYQNLCMRYHIKQG